MVEGASFGPGEPGILVELKEGEEEPGRVPLVTLTYVEGLKYTFGNVFLGRRSQGEFLYLDLSPTDKSPGLHPHYFTLRCQEDGALWASKGHEEDDGQDVSPSSYAEVSVSGGGTSSSRGGGSLHVGVGEGQRMRLDFGDILTVSTLIPIHKEDGPEEGGKEILRHSWEFLFLQAHPPMAEKKNESEDLVVVEAEAQVFGNSLIVRKLASFFPTVVAVRDLRLISPIWNEEGLQVLRKRARVTICSLLKVHEEGLDAMKQVSDFVQSELMGIKVPYWSSSIDLGLHMAEEHAHYYRDFVYGGEKKDPAVVRTLKEREIKYKKLLEDLAWLFDQNPNVVTNLVLACDVGLKSTWSMFHTILGGVQHSLTSLDLTLSSLSDIIITPSATSHQTAMMPQLPHLNTLSLSISSSLDDPMTVFGTKQNSDFLGWLLPGLGTVKYLRLKNEIVGCCDHRVFFANFVLKEAAKIRSQDAGKFACVSDVTIVFPPLVHIPISWNPFSRLEYLPMGVLKKVDLRVWSVGHLQLWAPLGRHAETLEELTLHLNFAADPRRGDQGFILFPQTMPGLKRLSVFLHLEGRDRVEEEALQFNFDNRNDGGRVNWVNYRQRFPALKELTVWPGTSPYTDEIFRNNEDAVGVRWEAFLPLLNRFILPPPQGVGGVVSSTLSSLHIPLVLNGRYHRALDNLESSFPNIVFPSPESLRRAREGPVWGAN